MIPSDEKLSDLDFKYPKRIRVRFDDAEFALGEEVHIELPNTKEYEEFLVPKRLNFYGREKLEGRVEILKYHQDASTGADDYSVCLTEESKAELKKTFGVQIYCSDLLFNRRLGGARVNRKCLAKIIPLPLRKT